MTDCGRKYGGEYKILVIINTIIQLYINAAAKLIIII